MPAAAGFVVGVNGADREIGDLRTDGG